MNSQNSITIIKSAPTDEIAKKILSDWFSTCRPKWKLPLDLCLGCFFLAAGMFSWVSNTAPGFIWMSFAGALLSFTVAFGYIPFLTKSALKINKNQSSYYKEKTYRFTPDCLYFSYEGANEVAIPLDRFTCARITQSGILLMNGDKLVLWFSHSDLPEEDEKTILSYLEKNGAVIDERR